MISFSASSTAASQRPGIQFNRNTSTVTDQKREVQAVVLCCVVLYCNTHAPPPSHQRGSNFRAFYLFVSLYPHIGKGKSEVDKK